VIRFFCLTAALLGGSVVVMVEWRRVGAGISQDTNNYFNISTAVPPLKIST
jgi:hypothetical protein